MERKLCKYLLWLLFAALSIVLVTGCGNSGQKEVKESIMRMKSLPVTLCTDSMELCMMSTFDTIRDISRAVLKTVVFIDSSECSSCALKHINGWNSRIESTEQLGDAMQYVFIISPKSREKGILYRWIAASGLNHPVYIDTRHYFARENKHIPSGTAYHTFLLDSNDSVLLVGNPVSNIAVGQMYDDILKETFGDRYKKPE